MTWGGGVTRAPRDALVLLHLAGPGALPPLPGPGARDAPEAEGAPACLPSLRDFCKAPAASPQIGVSRGLSLGCSATQWSRSTISAALSRPQRARLDALRVGPTPDAKESRSKPEMEGVMRRCPRLAKSGLFCTAWPGPCPERTPCFLGLRSHCWCRAG